MSLLTELIARQEERYVTVGSITYRLRSVDSAALAAVGHAYIVGVEQHLRLSGEESGLAQLVAELRQTGATAEQIASATVAWREDQQARRRAAHVATLADPDAAAAYRERTEAFALASVAGVGPAVVPADIEVHPVGYSTPTEPVRVVRAPPPTDRLSEAMALAERGEYPLWMIPHDHVEAIGLLAAQLAGGRAASVAAFRVGAVAVGGA